ncbi:MAG: glycosyltransferase family 2 protein [Desulfobacterales bacterium]|nr:glycosyltransferase family 2 protein [Desulfobacterales bacterium]
MNTGQNPEILILMGTYNGSLYIEDQIDSIQAQYYENWRLVIRDDGSTDNTLEIVNAISQKDNRVELLLDNKGNLGATANFAVLLKYAKENAARYVALADQDDVWVKGKLGRQLDVMLNAERENDGTPVLVYSDLMVVDRNLKSVSASMMAYQSIHHEVARHLNVLLIQNYVTGCTILFNNALLKVAVPVAPSALMHDWWLALWTAVCGKLSYIDEPLVYYRQHEHNEIGALNIKGLFVPRKIWRLWKDGNQRFIKSIIQAHDFYKIIDEKNISVPLNSKEFIRNYLRLWDKKQSTIFRMNNLMRLGVRKQNLLAHLIFVFRCILFRHFTNTK